MPNLVPVLLVSAFDERMWPIAREQRPASLRMPPRGSSLLQYTALGLTSQRDTPPIVVCPEAARFEALDQLRSVGFSETVSIGLGSKWSPAQGCAFAALQAKEQDSDHTILLISPAAGWIGDPTQLGPKVDQALEEASTGRVVRLEIETTPANQAEPHGDQAQESGLWAVRADVVLDLLRKQHPDLLRACELAWKTAPLEDGRRVLPSPDSAPDWSTSIQSLLGEDPQAVHTLPLSEGSLNATGWEAIRASAGPDAAGNATEGDVIQVGSHNCLLQAESRLVVAVGLESHVVVETKDAVLVAPLDQVDQIPAAVQRLEQSERPELQLPREVTRPWGSYDSLDKDSGFQVKRLTVKPGAALSLQLHRRRAEHWIVVTGVARITLDDQVFDLQAGGNTFIPIGSMHRIENPGDEILEIVEVQLGDYLGEDDIERCEDRYGRAA